MIEDSKLKEEIMKGDYISDAEDAYVKMVEAESKRSRIVKISMGTFYILLLVVSLFIV